jgi:hypothetical protein
MKKISTLLLGFLFVVFIGCATGGRVISEQEIKSTSQYRLYTKTPGSNYVSDQFRRGEKFQLCLWRGSGENVTFKITTKFDVRAEGAKEGGVMQYEETADIPASEVGKCIDILNMSYFVGAYYAQAIISGKRVASCNYSVRR